MGRSDIMRTIAVSEEEERLRRAIEESVRRCAAADRKENLELRSARSNHSRVVGPK
jgi:hypothetical protein